MKIVAFLQNAWFPVGTEIDYISKYIMDDVFRRRVLSKSYTGKRLIKIFGKEFFNRIIWQNVSLDVGARSDHCGKPDLEHVESVIKKHRPDLILTFGSVALGCLNFLRSQQKVSAPILSTRHPNARHFSDSELVVFREKIRIFMEEERL